MITINKRTSWIALLALLLIFAGCKGETPTAPPPGGGVPPGGTPPPTGVNIVLTASNSNPFVDNTVIITATVTDNNQPVPNGTAVELTTTNGLFTNVTPGVQSLIRTTTNGAATVNLSSSTPVVARVTATVNNITRFIDITFRAVVVVPCVPPDPRCPANESPTISAVTPSRGRPEGGQIIRITGTNFFTPVRVLFDLGQPLSAEGVIVASTQGTIDVITPAINLGATQSFNADITVITRAGAANELRVFANDAFRFENVVLTPIVYSLSPTSGPINGGTRVTIFGEGFQAPMQVFFGSAEAQIVEVTFGQIIVIAPDARSTNPSGSGTVTGPVSVSVVNIRSNTRGTSPQTFRYIADMQITTLRPLTGPATGGTDITIDGTGFDPPLFVTINGIEGQVLGATGTRLLVRTTRVPSPCSPPATVPSIFITNTENGDSDIWGDAPNESNFRFVPIVPEITAVSSGTAGGSASVTVRNPGVGALGEGSIRFTVVGRTIIPSPSLITDGTATTTFSIPLPLTGFTFPTEPCTTAIGGEPGTRLGPVEVPITFTNQSTACTANATIIVFPPPPNPCLTEPQPVVTDPAAGCATPPNASVAGAPASTTDTITIMNETEAQPLNINSIVISGPDAASFSISPVTATSITAGTSRTFTLTFDPSTVGPKNATVTFNTNSPTRPALSVCVTAIANP